MLPDELREKLRHLWWEEKRVAVTLALFAIGFVAMIALGIFLLIREAI